MGNAILAAAAAGVHPSVEAAVAAMVAPGRTFAPDPGNEARYDALYAVYRKLYPALKGLFAELAGVP
jgi:xylulokinase